MVIAALGCFADLSYGIAGILTYMTGFACLVGLSFTTSTPNNLVSSVRVVTSEF